jgi:hypothetical protein
VSMKFLNGIQAKVKPPCFVFLVNERDITDIMSVHIKLACSKFSKGSCTTLTRYNFINNPRQCPSSRAFKYFINLKKIAQLFIFLHYIYHNQFNKNCCFIENSFL